MTVVSDTELQAGLEAVAAAAGLQLGESLDVTGVGALAGPFVTRELVDADGATVVCAAVRDNGSAGVDDLCQALMQAATGGDDGIEGSPVAAGDELVARFKGTPFEPAVLTDGAEVQAVILTTADRRARGVSGYVPATPGGGGVDHVSPGPGGLDKLSNVALDVSVELGRTRVTLSEVLEYDVGSVVELDRAAGAPVDIRVNGTLLAQGEVVLIDDEYAVRITSIVEPGAQ